MGRGWPPTGIGRRDLLRGALATAGGLALGGSLTGCGSGGGLGGDAVEHWDWYVSQEPWVRNELELFRRAHPEIAVRRTLNAQAGYDQLFTLSQRSGDGPDVFFLTTGSVPLNEQVAEGWLLPLDRWADREWMRRFPPHSFAEGSNMFGGRVYSAPFTRQAPNFQLYVHNEVFRAAGLVDGDGAVAVPRTWDEVTRAAERIVARGGGDVYGLGFGNGSTNLLGWWFDVFVRAAGSPGGAGGLDLRVGRHTYGSDRNYTDLAELMMEWQNRGFLHPNSLSVSDEIARANFERGEFGMTVGGVWNQPQWTEHGFTDYSVTTLVGPTRERRGYFYSRPGGTLMAVNARSERAEEAFAWFDWWHSEEAGRRWTQEFQQDLSVHPSANDPEAITLRPFADYVALGELMLPGPQPWVRNPAAANIVTGPVQPDLGTVLAGLLSGQLDDAGAALRELEDRAQQGLDEAIAAAREAGHDVSGQDYVFEDWDITRPYAWEIPEYPA